MLTVVAPATELRSDRSAMPSALAIKDGRFRIEDVARDLRPEMPHQTIFVMLQEDIDRWSMADVVVRANPHAGIVALESAPATPLFAVLMALDRWNPDDELLVVDPLEDVTSHLEEFLVQARKSRVEGVIATTASRHPRDSHLLEESGEVSQVVKGRPVSHKAIAGMHWFRRCQDFVEAVERAILRDVRLETPPGLEEVWNEMILDGKCVVARGVGLERAQGASGRGDEQARRRDRDAARGVGSGLRGVPPVGIAAEIVPRPNQTRLQRADSGERALRPASGRTPNRGDGLRRSPPRPSSPTSRSSMDRKLCRSSERDRADRQNLPGDRRFSPPNPATSAQPNNRRFSR